MVRNSFHGQKELSCSERAFMVRKTFHGQKEFPWLEISFIVRKSCHDHSGCHHPSHVLFNSKLRSGLNGWYSCEHNFNNVISSIFQTHLYVPQTLPPLDCQVDILSYVTTAKNHSYIWTLCSQLKLYLH